MSKQLRIGLLAIFLALASFALPSVSLASHCRCGYGYGTGVIYNSKDCKYYPVPSGSPGVVYRAVDDKLIPVGKYGRCCHYYRHHHKHYYHCHTPRVTRVVCTVRPAHWDGFMEWQPCSSYCFYYVK